MKKLLVVEDNQDYRELLVSELQKLGYDVQQAESPIKGLEIVALNPVDVVLSDLNLPIMNGVAFTESVKNISPKTLCIILTGDPDEQTEIQSIKGNVDLYIEKRKSLEIITNYIERLLKGAKDKQSSNVFLTSKREDIVINVVEHSVQKNHQDVNLTPKEYEILKLFLLNKNVVISRKQFIRDVWQEPEDNVDERLVDSHIKRLREKLNSFSIMTVRGYGYRWNEVE